MKTTGKITHHWQLEVYQLAMEAGETQTWIEFAVRCEYITAKQGRELHRIYDHIMGKLVNMQNNPDVWLLKNPRTRD